ncbi:MAG: hypothetical protein HKL92_09650 [Candidatus Eremiobacteraeota bacterium]|nr:hypothetical protein [Candidatus Eremiobacteraeota bacterium]NNM93594.1 hypothetical protein [Candidatus Eremiobacteraeota bacterium]
MNYRIKHFDVLSVASIGALLYAGVALVLAIVVSLFSSLIVAGMGHMGMPNAYPFMMARPLIMVIFPIIYGVFAFIALAIITALYNLFAGWTGGFLITLEAQQAPPPASPQTLP